MNIPIKLAPSIPEDICVVVVDDAGNKHCNHASVREGTYEEDYHSDGTFEINSIITPILICNGCAATKSEADFEWQGGLS